MDNWVVSMLNCIMYNVINIIKLNYNLIIDFRYIIPSSYESCENVKRIDDWETRFVCVYREKWERIGVVPECKTVEKICGFSSYRLFGNLFYRFSQPRPPTAWIISPTGNSWIIVICYGFEYSWYGVFETCMFDWCVKNSRILVCNQTRNFN